MDYIEDHLSTWEVIDHRIEKGFHFCSAKVHQHSLGNKQPGPVSWNIFHPAQIIQLSTDHMIGGVPFGIKLTAKGDHIGIIHVEPLDSSRWVDSENTTIHAAAHVEHGRIRVIS